MILISITDGWASDLTLVAYTATWEDSQSVILDANRCYV
jgi:hypothetical protein